jgi:SAM-dependent methyltransferase
MNPWWTPEGIGGARKRRRNWRGWDRTATGPREGHAKPEEVLAALRLAPGQVIGDVGAETGHYARRLARAVGPEGRVYAIDIEQYMLEELERRALAESITNIVPILARPDNSLLPEASCDLILDPASRQTGLRPTCPEERALGT